MDIFWSDVHKAQQWLKELAAIGKFKDESEAYSVLKICLQALRNRLILKDAIRLGTKLPIIISGLYFSQWEPEKNSTTEKSLKEFIVHLNPTLARYKVDATYSLQAVCKLLKTKIHSNSLLEICELLPLEMKNLFYEEAEVVV